MAKKSWEEEYSPDIVERVKNRDYVNGGADAVFMNDEDYAKTLRNQMLWNSADEATRQALHEDTERTRAGYDYSGGADGSGYYSLAKAQQTPSFSYEAAPTYSAQYQNLMNARMNQILNRQPFSYDYESDPRWQAYKAQYEREGDRAMQNTLAQVSARTGGLASSYATNAAAQANNYYMQQLADKVPELYQMAYENYLNEDSRDRANLEMLRGMEQDNYNRYLNALSQYNTNRNFAYGQYADDWNRNYQTGRDAVADARYLKEFEHQLEREAYSDEQNEYNRALAAAQLAAQYGDYSGLAALGITPNSGNIYEMALASAGRVTPVGSGSGGSSGSSGGGGGGGGDDSPVYDDATIADAYEAFLNGDYSDEVINILEEAGYSRNEIKDAMVTDYESAIKYMKNANLPSSITSGLLTEQEWKRRKQSYNHNGVGSEAVMYYDSYPEYARDYIYRATHDL